jgi:MFS transporter, PHS family, inorganic phosphate transporter
MLAGCNLVGVIFTLALPESKGMSLEDVTGEIGQRNEELPLESPQMVDGADFIHSVDFL